MENNKIASKKRMIHMLRKKFLNTWSQGDSRQAVVLGHKILQLDSADYEVLYGLAEIYYNEKNLVKARTFAKKAIFVKKDYVKAYYLLGMAFFLEENKEEHYEEIIEIFEKMFCLDVTVLKSEYQSNAYAKLGEIYWDLDDIDNCMKYHRLASEVEPDIYKKKNYRSAYLFEMNHAAKFSRKEIFLEHVKYNEFLQAIRPYRHKTLVNKSKLRIGYISPDFRMHPVTFFVVQLLLQYDKENFEVYCYSNTRKTDEVTEFLKPLVTKWRDITDGKYEETARLIYEDEVDILVDFTGHTGNDNLTVLAYRPAPIQMSGIGYINTTGLDTVDYFITDSYCDPEGLNEAYFSECLVRLPQTHFCYTHMGHVYPCQEAPSLKNKFITFGSFNKFKKVTKEMLSVWARILNQVDGSKLILKSKAFSLDFGLKLAKEKLLAAGIREDQIDLRPISKNYQEEYNDIDIVLDTYPCAGGTTTFEALYMGVPVITLVGDSHVSRFGYSILKNLGLDEGIAYTAEEYIDKAVSLAHDQTRLCELHENLRERLKGSSLMNGREYVQNMEQVYRQIWNKAIGQLAEKQEKPLNAKAMEDNSLQKAALKQQGNLYMQQGELYKVLECVVKLLEINDQDYEAFYMGAAACLKLDDLDNALALAHKGILLNPDHIGTYMVMAMAYQNKMLLEETVFYLKKIIELVDRSPRNKQIDFLGQAWSLLAGIYVLSGDTEKAKESYLKLMDVLVGAVEKSRAYSLYLLTLHYDNKISAEKMFLEHKKYNQFFRGITQYRHPEIKPKDKLRVGYISQEFCQHAVVFFCYALLANHNTDKFTVFCYSQGQADQTTMQLQSLAANWRNIQGMSNQAAAELISTDGIDILVDLSGHTANNCLPILAYKPAPIQVSGIGYFNTTGLETVDYYITDCYADPWGQNDAYFSEKLMRLPHSHLCYNPRSDAPECQPAPCGHTGGVTFCCFNNFTKVTDEMLVVWNKILERIPNAKLVFKSKLFGSAYGKELVEKRLLRLGFSLQQIEFRAFTSNHMKEYLDMDIALDTFPYPGGATTCEALYMGVPVVTLVGRRHGARFGYSILKNIGFEEGIAYSEAEYIEKAVALASNKTKLNELHQGLRVRMQDSGLMNARQYIDDIEQAYREMWRNLLDKSTLKKK